GFFLGIIAMLLMSLSSIGPGKEPNSLYGYFAVVLLTITFGFWGSQMNKSPSEKIELPIRIIRIALLIAWIIIFYFKFNY
ncbi:hypothetical protein ACI3PL_25315, partial [Lacticaseibacillus paracasei]